MAFEKFVNFLKNAFTNPVEELTETLGEAATFPPRGANLLNVVASYDEEEVFGEVVFLPDDIRQTLDFKM